MNPSAGGIPVPMNRPVYLPEGTVLSFGVRGEGADAIWPYQADWTYLL